MAEDFLDLFRRETDVVALKPGETLFTKGDAGQHFYIVKSGELQVIDGNHVFDTIGAGGILGEMALTGDRHRSATVQAIGPAEVIPIDEKRFLFLVQQTPFFAIKVMRVMSDRLKAMNLRATSLPQ